MKVILTGSVGPHDLSEMMELDLEVAHDEEHLPLLSQVPGVQEINSMVALSEIKSTTELPLRSLKDREIP